jgi:PAS domain S-box-containing protein
VTGKAAGGGALRPARFALIYALLAAAALTGLYVALAGTDDIGWIAVLGLAAFVLVSSAGLYLALRLHVARLAESQTELLASLSRYRELFEASPDPMWVYDFDTLSFLAVNDEAVTRYGWSEAEFRTMSLADLLDAADVPLLLARFRRPGPGPSVPGEWRHRTKRGAHLWVEVSAQSIEFEGRRAGLAVARDVTDRHAAEEALVESEHQLRLGFELSPVGMAIIGRDGRITRGNPALAELVGRSGPRGLTGLPFDSLLHPEDLPLFQADADGMLDGAGPVRSRALRLLRPDGTTTHVAADMVLAAETADEPQFFSIQLRDTTHEARREGLEKAKVAIRDRIEQGQPLKGTLDEVVLLIEGQLDWALGVVMRVRAGVLELAAGDRVPPLLAGTLRSVAVDPSGAPCSRAAARNEPVVLTDVSASPAPARLPGLSAAGVRAWCSWPVSDPSGYVVATVDALRTRPVPLLPSEQDAMVAAAELVAAAMEASRAPAPELPVDRPAVTVRRVIDLREARRQRGDTGTGGAPGPTEPPPPPPGP